MVLPWRFYKSLGRRQRPHWTDIIFCLRGCVHKATIIATLAGADLRERLAIKPRLHLQYAAPPNKQLFPLQSSLFLVTTPRPFPSPNTSSMTMLFQLWREGRHRLGGAEPDAAVVAVEERHGVWLCFIPPFQRMQMTLKPARGLWRLLPNRAHIRKWPCFWMNTYLSCGAGRLCAVTLALGVTKVPTLFLRGAFLFLFACGF